MLEHPRILISGTPTTSPCNSKRKQGALGGTFGAGHVSDFGAPITSAGELAAAGVAAGPTLYSGLVAGACTVQYGAADACIVV